MTTANPKGCITVIASQDLSAAQYRFITNAGAKAGAGAKALGILQNNPPSGRAANVASEHLSKCVAGATIAKDAQLASDANAAAVTAATGNFVVARAMESAVVGDIFQVLVTTNSDVKIP